MLKQMPISGIKYCILFAFIIFHFSVCHAEESETANHFIYSGIDQCRNGNFNKGVSLFNRALEIQPQNYYAYLNRGVAFRDLNNPEKAISDFKKCIELDPDNPEAYTQLGFLSSLRGDFKDAIRYYSKSIELDPKDYHVYFYRGVTFSNINNHKNAISDLKKCIELEPYNPGAYFQLGFLSSYRGDFKDAIQHYSKSIELDPKFGSAYGAIGIVKSVLGNHDEANEVLTLGISRNPHEPMLYIVRGQILDGQGRCDEAIKDFEKGMSFDPEKFNTRMNIAWVLSTCPDDEIRNGKKALKIINDCRGTDEEGVETLKSSAAAYAELGNFEQAIAFQKKAIAKAKERKSSGKIEEIFFKEDLEKCFQQLKSYQQKTPWRTKVLPES